MQAPEQHVQTGRVAITPFLFAKRLCSLTMPSCFFSAACTSLVACDSWAANNSRSCKTATATLVVQLFVLSGLNFITNRAAHHNEPPFADVKSISADANNISADANNISADADVKEKQQWE